MAICYATVATRPTGGARSGLQQSRVSTIAGACPICQLEFPKPGNWCAWSDCAQVSCPECGGDGWFSEFEFDSGHNVREAQSMCRHCAGTGWIDTEPAGEEWLDEEDEQ